MGFSHGANARASYGLGEVLLTAAMAVVAVTPWVFTVLYVAEHA